MKAIPDKVNSILEEYFYLQNDILPGFLNEFYIYGSIGLGAFCQGISDIDFIAVISREVTECDIKSLKRIHKTIKKNIKKLNKGMQSTILIIQGVLWI